MDRIEIRALRVVGIVGALDEERAREQPLEIDIDIHADLGPAGATDRLDDTVDYGAPIARIERVVREERHVLLERVAARIAEEILANPLVSGVEVTVRKLRPPIPADLASTAVRIVRTRTDAVHRLRTPVRAYVALGSNLGDRQATLRQAVRALTELGSNAAVSHVYETDPVGAPDDSGPYLNMVVAFDTPLDPYALLARCQAVEDGAGRVRSVRNAARTLDVDVLLFGDVHIESAELTIPHPRMWERRFVVAPLADVAADRVPADWETRLPGGGVVRVADLAP